MTPTKKTTEEMFDPATPPEPEDAAGEAAVGEPAAASPERPASAADLAAEERRILESFVESEDDGDLVSHRRTKKATKPELDVTFERGEGVAQRLPSRRVMKLWMQSALELPGEVTVRFANSEEARELNKTYRGKDYATNVLTFDYSHEPVVRADIVVCLDVVEKEAREQFKRFYAHLAHLLIHGVLHAQGWDHETDEEAEAMEAREAEIMMQLGFENPYYDPAKRH